MVGNAQVSLQTNTQSTGTAYKRPIPFELAFFLTFSLTGFFETSYIARDR